MYYAYANGELLYCPDDPDRQLISPKLKLEKNKAGEFSFTINKTNPLYSKLEFLTTEITVLWDEDELFRGRVISCDQDFNNNKAIVCEGILAYLIDSVQEGKKFEGNVHDLFRKIISRHNSRVKDENKKFKIGQLTIENRKIRVFGKSEDDDDIKTLPVDVVAIDNMSEEWSTTYDYIQTNLVDQIGGYIVARRVGNENYIDYLADYVSDTNQKIEFGFNLLDLKNETNIENLFTVLIPIGDENLTIKKVNNGSDELVDKAGVAKYGRIVRTHVFDGVNDAKTLLADGKRYLKEECEIRPTITINAIDMHYLYPDVDRLKVGATVEFASDPHGLKEKITCTEVELDLENLKNSSYTFGNPKPTFTKRYKQDRDKSGGGGAARAGAGAAKKVVDENYDAYVTPHPEQGTVNIYAFARTLDNFKNKLETTLKIDLDGPGGSMVLSDITNKLDESNRFMQSSGNSIRMLTDKVGTLSSTMKLQSQWANDLRAKVAYIELTASHDRTKISQSADEIHFLNTETKGLHRDQETIIHDVSLIKGELSGLSRVVTGILDADEATIKMLNSALSKIDGLSVKNIIVRSGGSIVLDDENGRRGHATTVEYCKDNFLSRPRFKNNTLYSYGDFPELLDTGGLYAHKLMYMDDTWTGGSKNKATVASREYVKWYVDKQLSWANITDKPDRFKPAKHKHHVSLTTKQPLIAHQHPTSTSFKAGDKTGLNASKEFTIEMNGYSAENT